MREDMKWNRARAMANLYKQGWTMQAIADHFKVSKPRVWKILKTQTGAKSRRRGPSKVAIEHC